MPRRRGNGSERISDKDLEVLELVARYGLVPRSAVAVWAKTGRSVTLDRERRLCDAQLIERHRAFERGDPILTATRRGLRVCRRTELRPQRFSLWSIHHSLVVAHVGTRLELAGERVLPERELAAIERRRAKRVYSSPRGTSRGYHRPDLVVLGAPGAIAVEVELTNKAPRRLEGILRDWRRAIICRAVWRVLYVCPQQTLRHVRAAIGRIRAQEHIFACELEFVDGKLPRPTSEPSGGPGAAVKGLWPDPLGELTGAPPPLASRVGRGGHPVPDQ